MINNETIIIKKANIFSMKIEDIGDEMVEKINTRVSDFLDKCWNTNNINRDVYILLDHSSNDSIYFVVPDLEGVVLDAELKNMQIESDCIFEMKECFSFEVTNNDLNELKSRGDELAIELSNRGIDSQTISKVLIQYKFDNKDNKIKYIYEYEV